LRKADGIDPDSRWPGGLEMDDGRPRDRRVAALGGVRLLRASLQRFGNFEAYVVYHAFIGGLPSIRRSLFAHAGTIGLLAITLL